MLLAEARPAHARWSEANGEFLDFVARNPECLRRESYAPLAQEPTLAMDSIQPWPLFVGAGQRRELAAVALGMDRLMKLAIELFLDNDPARVVDFFRTPGLSEALVEIFLEEPDGVQSAPSRADYVETRDGLHCVEFNTGRCLGGLQSGALGELYLKSAPTARFLREGGRRARPQPVLGAYFRHLVDDTVRLGAWNGGDFNVAMPIRPHEPSWIARHVEEAWTRELCAALEAHGPAAAGRVLLCAVDDIAPDGGGLAVRGRPVHAVVDRHDGGGDVSRLFRAFKLGRANLFGGPVGALLGDKRNLALLSQNAGSDLLTAAERAFLERHLPWTRRVLPARTAFRGSPLRIPEDLPGRREELVLKKGASLGGQFVEVGRFHTADGWNEAVRRAVGEEDWVVQEYLEPVSYVFQGRQGGAVRHEVVWALFAFGEHFGGVFLRMQPAGNGGVVNGCRGAEISTMLEIVE
ncbi:MAG TPA: hypothetical protein VEX86_08320 [Longimicrobium sp.]|nr:hypothetical protein [Longimicrobium sp.]